MARNAVVEATGLSSFSRSRLHRCMCYCGTSGSQRSNPNCCLRPSCPTHTSTGHHAERRSHPRHQDLRRVPLGCVHSTRLSPAQHSQICPPPTLIQRSPKGSPGTSQYSRPHTPNAPAHLLRMRFPDLACHQIGILEDPVPGEKRGRFAMHLPHSESEVVVARWQ